jgi:hypothetical protein
MKVLARCAQCSHEVFDRALALNKPVEEVLRDVATEYLDFEGDGGFEFECPLGHKSAFVVNVPHHEVLFQSACMSFLGGSYREAVGSAAAARERFAELYVRVLAASAGVSDDEVSQAWAHLEGNSQRQFGAFVWTQMLVTRALGERNQDSQKREQFRNDVVHKGRFPTRNATQEYLEYIYDWIRKLDRVLRTEYDEARGSVLSKMWHHAARRLRSAGYKGSIGGSGYWTVFQNADQTFEEALRGLREMNPWVHPGERVTVKTIAEVYGLSVDEVITRIGHAFHVVGPREMTSDDGSDATASDR